MKQSVISAHIICNKVLIFYLLGVVSSTKKLIFSGREHLVIDLCVPFILESPLSGATLVLTMPLCHSL